MPSFFSWQLETVLFFLAEKEKNGFKKRSFGCGGNRKKRADRVVRPYKVRRKICGCADALQLLPDPHPSASQTHSPEGKAIRCGGDLGGQGRPPLRVQCWNRMEGISERRCAERRDLSDGRDGCDGQIKAKLF